MQDDNIFGLPDRVLPVRPLVRQGDMEKILVEAVAQGLNEFQCYEKTGLDPRKIAKKMQSKAFKAKVNEHIVKTMMCSMYAAASATPASISKLKQLRDTGASDMIRLLAIKELREMYMQLHKLLELDPLLDDMVARLRNQDNPERATNGKPALPPPTSGSNGTSPHGIPLVPRPKTSAD